MQLAEADIKSQELLTAILPFCVLGLAIVVGSTRRRVSQPKDIELVAVADLADFEKLNGIRRLLQSNRFGTVVKGMFPSRYTQIKGPSCNIDLFWCDKRTYGLNTFIRTGSAEFAAAGLSHWKKITNGGYSEGAILHLADGTPVPTLTELAVFEALKCKWVPPEKRNRD